MDLRDAIESRGFTVAEFRRQAGVSHGSIWNWISGRRVPDDASAERIASLLGVRPAEVKPSYGLCRNGHVRERRGRWSCWLCHTGTQDRHRPARNAQVRATRLDRKSRTVDAYGGVCTCCGESALPFLCVDHIEGGGNQERLAAQASGSGGDWFYRLLEASGYPPGYRVLCWNCNWGVHVNNGVCPHEVIREKGQWP